MKNYILRNAACRFCIAMIVLVPLQASGYSENDLQQFMSTHSCPRCDLSGAKLMAYDLASANLEGANLRGADLSGSTLSMADLAGADFSEANLTNVILEGADLYGANLEGVNLNGAKLDGAYLKNTAMDEFSAKNGTQRTKKSIAIAAAPSQVPSQSSQVMEQELIKGPPESAAQKIHENEVSENSPANKLVSAGAPLEEKAMVAASAHAPDQQHPNQAPQMSEAEASVIKSSIEPKSPAEPVDQGQSGANEETPPPPVVMTKEALRKAFLDSNICIECDLSGVDLSDKKMKNALVERSNFEGANLKDADLREANLKATLLRKANLSGADLRKADLYKADLEGADLRGADLRGALLDGAYLGDAMLEGARMDKDE